MERNREQAIAQRDCTEAGRHDLVVPPTAVLMIIIIIIIVIIVNTNGVPTMLGVIARARSVLVTHKTKYCPKHATIQNSNPSYISQRASHKYNIFKAVCPQTFCSLQFWRDICSGLRSLVDAWSSYATSSTNCFWASSHKRLHTINKLLVLIVCHAKPPLRTYSGVTTVDDQYHSLGSLGAQTNTIVQHKWDI